MMDPRRRLRQRPALAWWVGLALLVAVGVVVARLVEPALLGRALQAAVDAPVALATVLALYASAFVLRAVAWRRLVPGLGFGQALAAIHLSLAGNHVLPLRLGEMLRVTSVVRRADVPLGVAAASTLTLRAADIAAVVGLAVVLGPATVATLVGGWVWGLLLVAVGGVVAGVVWLRRLGAAGRVRLPGPGVAAAVLAAWLLESVVMWQAAAWAGVSLAPHEAILVTAVTIAAQSVAVAPGGSGPTRRRRPRPSPRWAWPRPSVSSSR